MERQKLEKEMGSSAAASAAAAANDDQWEQGVIPAAQGGTDKMKTFKYGRS